MAIRMFVYQNVGVVNCVFSWYFAIAFYIDVYAQQVFRRDLTKKL